MNNLNKGVDVLQDRLQEWFDNLVNMLPNYLVAIIILGLAFLVSRLVKRLTYKLLQRSSKNHAINNFFAHLAGFLVILLGLFISLDVVNLDKTFTSLLAGAGILGLAFSLGFQDVVANFVSSFMIATRKPYDVGNIIESNNIFGTVRKINMRSTHIRTPQGQNVVIPNRGIYQNVMINYTRDGVRRIDLKVRVSYKEDLETVKKTVVEAIEQIKYLHPDKKIELFFTEFGEFAIELVVRYWIFFSRQPEYMAAVSDGIENIKKAFDEKGIKIPFPIRTLDFSDGHGQKGIISDKIDT
jgi:small-conductance mechanosensitive channel